MVMKHIVLMIFSLFVLFLITCCSLEPAFNIPTSQPKTKFGQAIVLISNDFLPIEQQYIKNGIDMWVHASNKGYNVEYVPLEWSSINDNVGKKNALSNKCVDVVVFEMLIFSDSLVTKMDKLSNSGRTLGIGDHQECAISRAYIVVDRIHTPKLFTIVASHEFGHAIGLSHSNDAGSIMYKSVGENTNMCVTRPDAIEFCKYFFCDIEQLAYCNVYYGTSDPSDNY